MAAGCQLHPAGGQAALTGLLHGSVGWFHGGVSAPPTHEPPVTCRVVRGSEVASTFAQALEAIAPALRGRAVVLTRLSQPSPVSAAVIEELVDLLFEGGCGDVLVAAALSVGDRDRGHRSVQALAHTAGLTSLADAYDECLATLLAAEHLALGCRCCGPAQAGWSVVHP